MSVIVLIFLLFWPVFVYAQATYGPLNVTPTLISGDTTVRYNYDIVYVRAPRMLPGGTPTMPQVSARWADFSNPAAVNPGSDLMLLHPNGTEEVLVAAGAGAVQDPYVSFDGQTVYYTLFHRATDAVNTSGSDIYAIHVPTRTITRLTTQTWDTVRGQNPTRIGVYNMHPCPLPGGKIAFVSNRNGFFPSPKGYPAMVWQLHTMDSAGRNIETIGHLNLGSALHPTILTDGRLLFSSLEDMGYRNHILWGLWAIWPDGSTWTPVVSAFLGPAAPTGLHFQTQLGDGSIVFEEYYNSGQKGFGTLYKLPQFPPEGQPAFAAAYRHANPAQRFLGFGDWFQWLFTPKGRVALTLFATGADYPTIPSVQDNLNSPYAGKVTHPSGAPDNHLLLVWSVGSMNGAGNAPKTASPWSIDSGIYLLKDGTPVREPGQLLLIKNDPNYNEQWPRALVPYKRLYGFEAPKILVHSQAPQLPPGAPFGLIGTSSLYKRESVSMGRVELNTVTATTPAEIADEAKKWNWVGQGSDAGAYTNEEIAAIRIVTFEPNPFTADGRQNNENFGFPRYRSLPQERLRILGDIDVRASKGDAHDTDGNPDTSFLAKIPADVPFTFQMLDKSGMALTTAQTWHQVRPGEQRSDCGGCHAHSQQPTLFETTVAGQPGFVPADLTGPGRMVAWREAELLFIKAGVLQPNAEWVTITDNRNNLTSTVPKNYSTLVDGNKVIPLRAKQSPVMAQVASLTPEEQRQLVEWIDLGAQIDLAGTTQTAGLRDDTRPTLVMQSPGPGVNAGPLTRILIGMYDYTSGLDLSSFRVVADVTLDGAPAGQSLAGRFHALSDSRWEWLLTTPLTGLDRATLTVQIKDTAGNQTTLARTFSVAPGDMSLPPPIVDPLICVKEKLAALQSCLK